ncbi:MAG: DMT family transporter [Eubacterium sp.]
MNLKKSFLSKSIVVWLLAAVCCFLWGSAFPAIKIGYHLFKIDTNDIASILLFAGLRFALAGVLTIIIFSIINKKPLFPYKNAFPKIGVLSLFQTIIQYVFFYLGLAYTTGDRASVIQGTNVFMALMISSLIFKLEKLSANKILGSIIGFAGVLIVSLDVFTQNAENSFKGEIFVLLSTVSYAFSSVFMKRYSAEYNPAMLSGWQFVLGGAVMILCGLISGGHISVLNVKSVLLLIYLAMLSAVAYSLWSILLKYNPVSKVTVCGFLTPVFGFILSSLFAGEGDSMSILGVIALLLVVIGMVLVNKQNNKILH